MEHNNSSFAQQIEQNIIPRIKMLVQKESVHLEWLKNNDAPDYMIDGSELFLSHCNLRLEDYIEYLNVLKQ